MASHGTVALKSIWKMLDACAPGYTREKRPHNWCVRYNGKTFPSLPVGEHGRRENPDIQIGVVKQMIRQLGISAECVAKHLR